MSAGNASIQGMAAMDAGSTSAAALAWEPRLNGVPAGVQREIRRGIASNLGVPPAWVAPTGQGLPQWWLRTSFAWTWRWKMSRTSQPMRLRLEAHVVCAVPTRRWSFGLRLRVRERFQAQRSAWTEVASEAWAAAERDGHHRKPRHFGFRGDGPALHPSEGQGGAPMSYLLRTSDLRWEVLAASHHKAWVRMVAEVPLADLDEGAWLSDSLSRRREKDEERALRRARAAQLPAYWQEIYWERLNERLRQGTSPRSAHAAERRAWGSGWVRQPGDLNDYGVPGCGECNMDRMCTMCTFAAERQTNARDLVRTDWVWRDAEDAEAWGPPDLEARQLVRQGLLDQVEDPEAGVSAAWEAQAGGEEAGEASQAGGQDDRHEGAEESAANAGQAQPSASGYLVIEDSARESDVIGYDDLEEVDYLSIGEGSRTDEVGDDWMMIDEQQ